ncbi:hypothetical protein DIPPA_19842 [Diplonema papillatum]|nr:hypothetical protein DIPPA_19842 [Diplonema papillatum]
MSASPQPNGVIGDLAPVTVPADFAAKFRDLINEGSSIYAFRAVEKLTTKNKRQGRVLVLKEKHVVLFDTDGHIKRIARVSDIEKCAKQPSTGGQTVCIKFYPPLREPTLCLMEPARLAGDRDVLDIVDTLRRRLRAGEALPVTAVDAGRDIRMALPDFIPWEKPHGYQKPRIKFQQASRFLWDGSVEPVARAAPPPSLQRRASSPKPHLALADDAPGARSPISPLGLSLASQGLSDTSSTHGKQRSTTNAFAAGDVVELTNLTNLADSSHLGRRGLVLYDELDDGKVVVGFPHPLNVQRLPPSFVRLLPGTFLSRETVAAEYTITTNYVGEEWGIEFTDDLLIKRTVPDGPAARAGVGAGRKLLSINNVSVSDGEDAADIHGRMAALSFPITASALAQSMTFPKRGSGSWQGSPTHMKRSSGSWQSKRGSGSWQTSPVPMMQHQADAPKKAVHTSFRQILDEVNDIETFDDGASSCFSGSGRQSPTDSVKRQHRPPPADQQAKLGRDDPPLQGRQLKTYLWGKRGDGDGNDDDFDEKSEVDTVTARAMRRQSAPQLGAWLREVRKHADGGGRAPKAQDSPRNRRARGVLLRDTSPSARSLGKPEPILSSTLMLPGTNEGPLAHLKHLL